jgi:hypothetical protein
MFPSFHPHYRVSIKSFPWLQTFITRKLPYIGKQTHIFFKKVAQEVLLKHVSALQYVLPLLHGERLIDNQFLSTASTVSSLTLGLPLLLRSPTLPVSTNSEYHALMHLTSGGGRPYSFQNFRCTVIGDFVSWNHKTHRAFSFIDAVFVLAGYATVT